MTFVCRPLERKSGGNDEEMWLVRTRHLLRQIWHYSYWLFNFICFSERVVWLGYGYVLNCHKQKQLKYSFFHE
jgi:hypothetical protein